MHAAMWDGHMNITACEISHIKKDRLRETAQPVKTLVSKHNDLSLTPGSPKVEGENRLQQAVL